MKIASWVRSRVRKLKCDVVALWLAAHDPRVPWHAKAFAGVVAAYALSPFDLIPDFVPVIGYFDNLIIVPAGVFVAIRLMPAPLWQELRAVAAEYPLASPVRAGIAIVVSVWLVAAVGVASWYWPTSGI